MVTKRRALNELQLVPGVGPNTAELITSIPLALCTDPCYTRSGSKFMGNVPGVREVRGERVGTSARRSPCRRTGTWGRREAQMARPLVEVVLGRRKLNAVLDLECPGQGE